MEGAEAEDKLSLGSRSLPEKTLVPASWGELEQLRYYLAHSLNFLYFPKSIPPIVRSDVSLTDCQLTPGSSH